MLFARLCKTFFEGNNAQKYLVHTNWVDSLFIFFALFTRLASFYGPLKEFGFCQFYPAIFAELSLEGLGHIFPARTTTF